MRILSGSSLRTMSLQLSGRGHATGAREDPVEVLSDTTDTDTDTDSEDTTEELPVVGKHVTLGYEGSGVTGEPQKCEATVVEAKTPVVTRKTNGKRRRQDLYTGSSSS